MHVGSFNVKRKWKHVVCNSEKYNKHKRKFYQIDIKKAQFSTPLHSSPVGGSDALTAGCQPSLNAEREEERNHGWAWETEVRAVTRSR